MRILKIALGCLLAMRAAGGDYNLVPQMVAEGVYVFLGRQESFSRENGGNIANTGFIVDPGGVTVIDSGPSLQYGQQQRAAIARISALPITRIYITHAHPDHFLGSEAYAADSIYALPATIESIRANGEGLSNNMYRLVGGWMTDTQVVIPEHSIIAEARQPPPRLSLMSERGHTDGDLMVYDTKSRTLFSGDLVFSGRAPTTPNADIDQWLAALDRVEHLGFKMLVPGHGPISTDHAPVTMTRDYLRWLRSTLTDAAQRGLDMSEVMRLPLPPRFAQLAVVQNEYARSVSHLYPKIELAAMTPVAPR